MVNITITTPDTPNSKNRKKRKKGKEGPKRHLSSYMLFVQKERPGIVEKNPDAKFTDIGKLLGSHWAKLNEEEKKKYVDMASDDKVRYNHEVTQYQSSGEHDPLDVNDHSDHGHEPADVASSQLLPLTTAQSQIVHPLGPDSGHKDLSSSDEDDDDSESDQGLTDQEKKKKREAKKKQKGTA